MSLITRNNVAVQERFGLRDTEIPSRGAPAVTVTHVLQGAETFITVAITTPVSGAASYSANFVNPATGADLGTIHFTTAGVLLVPNVTANTKFIYQVRANPGGLALQADYDLTVSTPIAEATPAVIAATYVGDPFIITRATWTTIPASVTYVIQEDADGVGAGTPLSPTPTLVPAGGAGKFYRIVETAMGPMGNTATSTSAYIGPIQAAPLAKLTSANVTLGPSVYWPDGQTTWFKPTIVLTGVPGGNTVQWSGASAISYPVPLESHWKNLEVYDGDLVPVYDTLATDAATRPPNFSLWRAAPDSPDRANLRFRHGTGGAWSQASDPAWYIEEPEEVLPDPGDLVYRQLIRRTDAQIPGAVTPDNPDFYDGIFMGDGQQYFPSMAFSANGAKVLAGQDCAPPMMSLTSGRTWFRPRSLGLKLLMTRGVASDPNNGSRWFALHTAGYQTTKQNLSGLYVTSDDADNWNLVAPVPSMGNTQSFCENITCYPATGGATAKWYFAVGGEKNTSAYFNKSGADNGSSWGTLASLAWATYGRIYKLQASRHTPGLLFMATGNGLKRSTNDGVTWSTLPGNLPTSNVRWFWIDPVTAGHMFAVVASLDTAVQGLYETTTATAATPTWTRIRACPAHWAAVGASDAGDRAIYVKCGATGSGTTTSNNTDHVRLKNGTWITRATSPTAINLNLAGAQGNAQPFTGMCVLYSVMLGNGQQMTGVQAHPTDPEYFVIHGNTSFFTTSDEGRNVNLSMAGYGGLNMRSTHYDPYDRNSIVASCQDVDPGISTNGGKSIYTMSMPGYEDKCEIVSGLVLGSFHCWTVVKVPGDVTATAWRNQLITAGGASNLIRGAMGYINADGTSGDWMGSNPTQGQTTAGGSWLDRPSSGFLRHDHNKVWCGPNTIDLSVGAGATWGLTASSRPILGAAQDGTDTIYAVGGQVIYRSTNFGASWATFHTFSSSILDLGAPIGRPSLYDGRRMFYRHGSRSFTMLFDNAGTAAATVFDLATAVDTEGRRIFDSPYEIDATIAAIVGDALDERYIYIATNTMGSTKRVFRGKFNAGFSAITWENITSNGSTGAPAYQLFTTGLHGCLHTSPKDHGSYIFPSPVDWKPRVGAWAFSGQPANNQTLVVNGVTWTFKTSGATTAQTNIGASLSATLTQLATDLNASANASITPCTYTARYGNLLEVTMDNPTQGVNASFPLTAGTTSNATVINAAVPCKDRLWLDCPLPIHEVV